MNVNHLKEKLQKQWDALPLRHRFLIILGAGFVLGLLSVAVFSPGNGGTASVHTAPATPASKPAAQQLWTCSMHPQIRLPHPGKCPICGMTLIPVHTTSETTEGTSSERRLVMSPDAMKLAQIQTSPVERKFVAVPIRMAGKIAYDESRVSYITAWVGGRIDRLYIDETGIFVSKGDHMAYVYSPELLSAQEEYLQALDSIGRVKDTHLAIIKTTSEETVVNAREKLKLLGVTDEQITELEKRHTPSDHMTIYAPTSGIVVRKEVEEGDYVKTGQRIYSIVDLHDVWAILDAYESDIVWLRYGQDVSFEAEAYPGDTFHGRISFISPLLDEKTRTIKVRVNVDNSDGKLKPGMFVRAVVSAEIARSGQVMDPYLDNKWICPMHPSIIRDKPGTCPLCGMTLVSTKEMGYVSVADTAPPLVVPASAVLKTGTRAVVYVQDMQAKRPTFNGREIVLGPRAGDYYLVTSGLTEGEQVVTEGNFMIDSALQIEAKPSMMDPEGGGSGGSMMGMNMHMSGGKDTQGKAA